jgi:phage baseplate assembly protein W
VSAYPSSNRPSGDERARRRGRDILFDDDFHVASNHDWQLVEGEAALRQWVYHCLITSPGEYAARPDFGVGVEDFLKEELTESRQAELTTRIKTNLQRDKRIQSASAVVDAFDDGNGLTVSITIVVRGQALTLRPFAFTQDGVST